MTRVAYFVHGRGKGHAVRTEAVMQRVADRYEVRLFCAGSAFETLGTFPFAERVNACTPGRGMMASFALRFRSDRDQLRRWKPHLVVSDGDGPSVNAAKSIGLPVLAIGHGLVFGHARLDGVSLPRRKRLREVLNAASSSWPASRRVAIHFAPAEPRTARTYIARPDLHPQFRARAAREDFMLAYFRDDDGFAALEELSRRGHRVVLFGRPHCVPASVEVHPPDIPSFREALGRCRAVVGSAGNHLPAECAMLGLPMLALYHPHDAEHEMNAHLIEAAGIGLSGTFEHCAPELVRRFEAELEKPRDELMARTREMRPASEVIPTAIELCL